MVNQKTPYNNVIIAGCGAVGRLVGARWQDRLPEQGVIHALVQSDDSATALSNLYHVTQTNLDNPEPALPEAGPDSLIYYFVPPPPTGSKDTRCAHFLSALSQQTSRPARIVAISTTGVYGDCGGELVTEEHPLNPNVDRARRRHDMETQLKNWCEQNQVDLIILRVGGIYGPDRLPLARIKKGIPMLKEELAPKTNRIHEHDLATILVAAADVDHRYRVYNVSDGTNSNMAEYFNTIADHFGLARPPAVNWQQAEQQISTGMLSYLRESRRIDNSRMLRELGIKLKFPTLEHGLKEIDPQMNANTRE